jgi:hypothetical protein
MSAEEQAHESKHEQQKHWHVSDSFHPSRCQSTRYARTEYWRTTRKTGAFPERISCLLGRIFLRLQQQLRGYGFTAVVAAALGISLPVDNAFMSDCPACGNRTGSIYPSGCRALLCGVDGEWSINECSCCGLLFTVPRCDEAQAATFYLKHYPALSSGARIHSQLLSAVLRSSSFSSFKFV